MRKKLLKITFDLVKVFFFPIKVVKFFLEHIYDRTAELKVHDNP